MGFRAALKASGLLGHAGRLIETGKQAEAFLELLEAYSLTRDDLLADPWPVTAPVIGTAAVVAQQLCDLAPEFGSEERAFEILREVHGRLTLELQRHPSLAEGSIGDWMTWAEARLRENPTTGRVPP
jgi:hypothetical protein